MSAFCLHGLFPREVQVSVWPAFVHVPDCCSHFQWSSTVFPPAAVVGTPENALHTVDPVGGRLSENFVLPPLTVAQTSAPGVAAMLRLPKSMSACRPAEQEATAK